MFALSYALLWCLITFQILVCVGLLRKLDILRRIPLDEELPVGSRLPRFAGIDARTGERLSSDRLTHGGILLLLQAGCASCVKVTESLSALDLEGIEVLAVCSGANSGCEPFVKALYERVHFLLQSSIDVQFMLGVKGSPTAVIVDRNGTIAAYKRAQDASDLLEYLDTIKNVEVVPAE